MIFPVLLLMATWLSGITASSSPTAGASVVAPSESPTTSSKIVIAVGKGSFSFFPNSVTAKPGDEIIFEFWSSGHSVARSAFGFPCMPYEYIVPGETGFWSGHVHDATPILRPTFRVTVNDTEPAFFYCAAADSCKGNRMIGVINPNSTWTLADQDSFINSRVLELQPGDPIPSESNRTEPDAADGQDASDDDNDLPALSDGEIAGVAMSSVALVVLVGALAFTCIRQRRLERRRRKQARSEHLRINPHPNTNSNTIPLMAAMNPLSPRTYDDGTGALKSPPPLRVGGASMGFIPPVSGGPQPTNSGHWSMTSGMTAVGVESPRRNSFRLCLPGVVSNVPSETSLVYYSEQQHRSEVPGSPVPVELPAANECRVDKSS